MSVNEESNQTTSNDEAASNAPAKTSNETKPSTAKQPSRLYARLRPSPSSTPARTASTSGSSFGKEEKIVMDNLPVRATAPASLIDEGQSSHNRDRSSHREVSSRNERPPESTEQNNDSSNQMSPSREERREGEVKKGPVFETHSEEEETTPISQIQEFKPSRDHTRKRGNNRSSREDSRQRSTPSTGLFGWLKSLFSSETETNEETESLERSSSRTNYRNGNQRSNQNRRPRGSRGGQNRGNNQRRSRNSNSRNRNSSSR